MKLIQNQSSRLEPVSNMVPSIAESEETLLSAAFSQNVVSDSRTLKSELIMKKSNSCR